MCRITSSELSSLASTSSFNASFLIVWWWKLLWRVFERPEMSSSPHDNRFCPINVFAEQFLFNLFLLVLVEIRICMHVDVCDCCRWEEINLYHANLQPPVNLIISIISCVSPFSYSSRSQHSSQQRRFIFWWILWFFCSDSWFSRFCAFPII